MKDEKGSDERRVMVLLNDHDGSAAMRTNRHVPLRGIADSTKRESAPPAFLAYRHRLRRGKLQPWDSFGVKIPPSSGRGERTGGGGGGK